MAGFVFILISAIVVQGQQKVLFISISENDSYQKESENITLNTVDSIAAVGVCAGIVNGLIKDGYITSVVDTLYCITDTCFAKIYRGNKYITGTINFTKEEQYILSTIGIKKNILKGSSFSKDVISGLITGLTQFYANTGYPFAKVQLDSIAFDDVELTASLKSEKGPVIVFDTFRNAGNLELSRHFLSRYLQISPGDRYNHSKVLQAGKRLSELNFIKQDSLPTITFINNNAYLNLNAGRKPANRFDFIIGVLRQPNTGSSSGNFVISGDILAEFNNRFGQGEYVMGQFKRLRPENQEVILKSDFPYLPGLPIGAHLDFRLFKFGTDNLDVLMTTGAQYVYGGFNQLKLSWHYRSSRLIEINSASLIQSNRLPSRLDVVYSGVGFSLISRHVDYRFNPTKGIIFQAGINGGNRSIIPNIGITSLEGFENSYDTLNLKSLLVDATLLTEYYFPIGDRFTLKSAINAGIRYNETGVLENEKFRMGGNRMLRGFDEESIFSDRFVFLTSELRLIFDQNSFLSLPFIDFGFTRVRTPEGLKNDRVIGVGLGLNFGTAAGVFNIAFAAGSRLGNPLDFGQIKIHFGYISLF